MLHDHGKQILLLMMNRGWDIEEICLLLIPVTSILVSPIPKETVNFEYLFLIATLNTFSCLSSLFIICFKGQFDETAWNYTCAHRSWINKCPTLTYTQKILMQRDTPSYTVLCLVWNHRLLMSAWSCTGPKTNRSTKQMLMERDTPNSIALHWFWSGRPLDAYSIHHGPKNTYTKWSKRR